MTPQTVQFVKVLLQNRGGDVERTARFMRDSLRIAGLRQCRELIRQAREAA